MNQIIVKIPRTKQKIKIIKSEDIIRREFDKKVKELELKFLKDFEEIKKEEIPEIIEEIIEEIVPEEPKPKKTFFSEVYTISDSNEPIEIDLRRVPEETITIDEAAKEIQAAYDKGFQDGQDSARAVYETEININAQWIKRFDSIAFKLKQEFLKEQYKFEESVIDLSLLIAQKILSNEAINSENLVINQIQKVFSELTDEEVFKIALNEADYEVLTAIGSDLLSDIPDMEKISIVKSDKVERGGCLVHTSAGIIDARIKTQLDRLNTALLEKRDKLIIEKGRNIPDTYPDILDSIVPNAPDVNDLDLDNE